MKKTFASTKYPKLKLYSREHAQLLTTLRDSLIKTSPVQIVFTPNAEQIVQASRDEQFAKILSSADFLLAESGPALAQRFLHRLDNSQPIATKFAGIDVVQELIQMGNDLNFPILIIGGKNYPQESGVVSLQLAPTTQKNSLHWLSGYDNVSSPTEQEEQMVKNTIQKLQPKIIFVAFGAPWQEQWIVEHRALLSEQDVRIAMAVGGSFDVLLGKLQRAPQWMRSLYLEWLYRLIQEPWRWKRQLRLLEFGLLILKAAAKK
ncbi:MAG: WecB/TagA/CpsF family glycosyltransferase [Microgenomates group bacterium]